MSNEILTALEYFEKEKGIPRADMIETIIISVKNAVSKGVYAGHDIKVSVDPKSGRLEIFTLLTVVDSVSDQTKEIHVKTAGLYAKNPKLGDTVEKPTSGADLGRIAAQAASQGMKQRLRQYEKERIYEEYKGLVGTIVTGTVGRRDHGDITVNLGKAEAVLREKERSKGEDFSVGDRVRFLLLEIETTTRGPEIILSRANPNFVKKLLELEVAEISDGTVFIAALARNAGERTKIAVDTRDPKVDPVGACVGARGARVRNIVNELGKEKVDIIRWYPDPVQMLQEVIKPAAAKNIRLDEKNHRIYFEVAEEDLSLAIGRGGNNARLTSRLLGWQLDIGKEERRDKTFGERMGKAVSGLQNIPGISTELAERLVQKGFTSIEAFNDVSAEDLVSEGFEPAEASMIIDIIGSAKNGTGA